MSTIHIFLDWDDTCVNTTSTIADEIHTTSGWRPEDTLYLNAENDRGFLQPVLNSGAFMAKTTLLPEHFDLVDWMHYILATHNVDFNVLTHRGYHKDAEALTADNITRTGMPISRVIYLDPKVHYDKAAWLAEHYPRSMLVDDRPLWNTDRPLAPNVLVYDRPWNQHMVPFKPEYRVTSSTEMRSQIERFIENARAVEHQLHASLQQSFNKPFAVFDCTNFKEAAIHHSAAGYRAR